MTKDYCGYLVYEDGRVFSTKSNKFLKGDNVGGYIQYTLCIEGKTVRLKAHRLVAMLFLERIEGKNVVNHIDGNKLNNHYSNLEWCDHYHNNKHARDMGLNNVSESNSKRWQDEDFRNKTSKKLSESMKGLRAGRKNPSFKYLILHNNKEISRQELQQIINRSMSNIDVLLRKSASGECVPILEENDIKVYDTKKSQLTIERVLHNEAV